ncbi:threonine synthase [Phycisphaerae bacterium]|jgi:threonine synthase|nr:threonine synthase [Phycisphaerae bacterium]
MTDQIGEHQQAFQRCINAACGARYDIRHTLVACKACGNLLDVDYDWSRFPYRNWTGFEQRSTTTGPRSAAGVYPSTPAMLDFSGVWRFRDLMPFYGDERHIVTIGEGRTNLQRADQLANVIGMDAGNLFLQYEGFNPSGSFKDNGMTAAFTHARMVGAKRVACASTGNTSAALAVYGTLTGMRCYVFIGDGKIAYGKLSQALEYGATTLQVAGDFDACLARIRYIAEQRPEVGVYLMNSVNPFRLEGQKSIMFRVLEGLNWEVPDWIVVPGGNLGNCSAFGKAFMELHALGMIKKVPRLAVIQAAGSRTLDRIYNDLGVRWEPKGASAGGQVIEGLSTLRGTWDMAEVDGEYARMDAANERAHTIATAIEINRPVNLPKALRALHAMNGVVRSVDDHCIVEHKALVGRYGFGCEPASAASVAGARVLLREGVIKKHERVVCILTGHVLKDPDVTVAYHTGMSKKEGGKRGDASRDVHIPLGCSVNRPIRVPDDLDAILKVMEA